ncbi:heme exporter protein CcmD [Geminicoccus roseus]|uniref:heme exporter protein CcmD n=1 Tax=Geminicoccus roseus TaxID=404900 RepID=UPI0004162F67|nr:heme exporter protein CcmD [Geminicoccus roseus]
MSEFLRMSGYAVYVWPAFGFTILVLGGLWLLSLRRMRAKEAELEELRGRMRAQRPARQPAVIRPRRETTPPPDA